MIELKYSRIKNSIIIDGAEYLYNLNEDIEIESIKNEFNNSLIKIFETEKNEYLWLTRTFERNTLQSKLFEDTCFIILVIDLLNKNKNNKVVIYTNRDFIFNQLRKIIKPKKSCSGIFKFKRIKRDFINNAKDFFFISKFIFNVIYSSTNKSNIPKKSYIIQTWINESNFKSGVFKDSYFPGLVDFYKKNNIESYIWPIIYNCNAKSIRKKVNALENVFNIYAMINLLDLLDLLAVRRKKNIKKNCQKLIVKGIDLTDLLKQHLAVEIYEDADVIYLMGKRIERSKKLTFIVNHENMISEKALIMGLGSNSPGTTNRVFALFHSAKPRNLLCLDYNDSKEIECSPKPNRILFNSKAYLDYFRSKDESKQMKLLPGFAFKQTYLKGLSVDSFTKSNSILVLLPGDYGNSIFLINMLKKTKFKKITFVFRMHPMVQIPISLFDESHMVIDKCKGLVDSISSVEKVISFYSAAALESSVLGKKVGLVYNPQELKFDPFDDSKITSYSLISNLNELSNFIQKDDSIQIEKNTDFFFLNPNNLKNFL